MRLHRQALCRWTIRTMCRVMTEVHCGLANGCGRPPARVAMTASGPRRGQPASAFPTARAARGQREQNAEPHYPKPSAARLPVPCAKPGWSIDFTCIRLATGSLYAATVMGLYARCVVVWFMSATKQAKMVSDALRMALWQRGKRIAPMHHSDQGSHYASDEFQRLLKDRGVTCGMSRRREWWGSAPIDSFASFVKTKRTGLKVERVAEATCSVVFDCSERTHNSACKHSKLDSCSPVQFEKGLKPEAIRPRNPGKPPTLFGTPGFVVRGRGGDAKRVLKWRYPR